MTRITLDRMSKRFAETVAVSEFSLEAAAGEAIALMGPSGSGKSTILRIVAGLDRQSSGDVHFSGRRVNDVPAKERDLTFVAQNYPVYPHLTVLDNLSFGLRLRGVPADEIARRVDEAADLLRIAPLLPRRAKELSSGERQRAAVGRALVRRAPLVLLDDPLSTLDRALRAELRGTLRDAQRRLGQTVIVVTADREEAGALADRIVLLSSTLSANAAMQGGPR